MAVIKRFNELLNLDEIDVFIDDVDKSKHIIITDMPESLPQGRSSFAIEVSPYMRDGVELQIDFIDSEGASIYTEPVANYLEGTARRVSVEVYSDTAPGIATLIVVGELEGIPDGPTVFSESDPVPKEYEGHYNIRLTKQVLINPIAPNTQPIKFFTEPVIRVNELVKGTMSRTEITGSITSSLFDVEGIPSDKDLLFKPYGDLEEDRGSSVLKDAEENKSPKPATIKNVAAYTETKKLKFRKGLRKNSIGKRSGFIAKTNSPPKFPYLLKPGTFNGNETFRFSTKHIGGTVRFFDHSTGNLFENTNFYPTDALANAGLNLETPTYDTSKIPGQTNLSPTPYTASIVDLINDQTALIDAPFTNKNVNNENIILPIFAKAEIDHESLPTGSYAAANLISYANVRLSNMRTFSGDVFKVKVYVKPEGGFDDYKLLAEVPLEGRELLVDDASVGQGERTGYPIMQSEISDYWDVYGGPDGLYEMTAAAADLSASYNNSVLLDSIQLSGSISNSNHNIRFQLKDNYKFILDPKLDYTLTSKIVGKRTIGGDASLLMYISGSCMKQKKFLYSLPNTGENIEESSDYGKRLGALEVTAGDDEVKDFGVLSHNFSPDLSGSAVLQFRVLNGEWNISDISITPAEDIGFSPPFFEFTQEIPSTLLQKRPDNFEFLVEFYDSNNNIADTTTYVKDVRFDGSNLTITGNDNVLESSLFIGGDTIGGGMHLGGVTSTLPETGGAGAEGSGFMRSVGYQGFISASAQSGSYGFMIYSGSVLPNSGDNYKGVGLELVGASGSFKFRTNPSVFDVRADSFFVGRKHEESATGIGQFMSGSLGNIEISSSLFHLDPINDSLIIGAGTTIKADLTANTIRTPAEIGGAQSTDANASSSINSQGLARFVSASIGGWTVGTGSIESVGGSLVLDPAGRQFRVSDGSNDRVHLGQTAPSEFGMKIFDGSGTADSDILVELGEGGNTIGGWTITQDTLTGGDMIIQQDGTIKSANYVKDQAGSGFILTAAEGGFLEVENAKIRGTMATTTFEKESVNAVGGQLYVANSTTLTGSTFPTTAYPGGHANGVYQANETTMSVVNVSGFSVGEVLTLKKVHSTGFSTEYVRVNSSSVANPGSDTDLSGQLYVTRGYSGSLPSGQDSSSLGDVASSATFYSGSQVIVSTGKIGTGFIRINANPNDSATPYIDIVERTGSAIYDTELKVRLGDLSGVAGTRNVPSGFTGFGLMSEVAFLSGSMIKLEAPTFLLGDLNKNFVSGSNSNLEISSSKFHLTPEGELSIGFVDIDDGAAYLLRIEEEVTCSLDHHYKFDGPTSNTLSSGSNITDEITSGTKPLSTTTDHSGVEYRRGIVGQSIYTSGSAFYANNTGPTTNDIDFSLAMWFNADDVHFNVNEQLLLAQSSTENGINLWITGSNLYGSVWDSNAGSGDQTVVNYPVDSGEWYHTALTYKASEDKLILYLNGVNVDEATLDADTTINVGNVNSNETMVAGVRGGTRFNYGSSTTTSVSDTSNTAGPTKNSFTGYVDDVRLYSQRLTPEQVVSLATVKKEKAFHFNPITEEVQINSKKFFFGNDRTQYVSGSNGNIEISSSNFHVTAEGQITASSMNLKGVSVVEDVAVADYFAYRNVVIDQNNYTQYLSEVSFTNRSATRTGWILFLDGSLGGDMGAFVTIDDLADDINNYPIIGIVPPSQNAPGTAPPASGAGSGHRIIIEAKGAPVFFVRNSGISSDTNNSGLSSGVISGGYFFSCDRDDLYFFGFSKNRYVEGHPDGLGATGALYSECLKIEDGARIEFARSNVDYKIQSISSLQDIGMSVTGGTGLFNIRSVYLDGGETRLAAPFMMGGGWNSNGLGTLAISANSAALMQDTSELAINEDGSGTPIDSRTIAQGGGIGTSTSGSFASASIAIQHANNNWYHMGPVRHTFSNIGITNKTFLSLGGINGWPANNDYAMGGREGAWYLNGKGVINPFQQDYDMIVSAKTSPSKGPGDAEKVFMIDAAHGVVGIGRGPGGSSFTGVLDVQANFDGYIATLHNDGNNENRFGLRLLTGTDDASGDTVLINFLDGNGHSYANIANSNGVVTYGAFTGAHYAYVLKSESNLTDIHKFPSGSESGSVYPFGTIVSMVSSSVDPIFPRQPFHYVVSSSTHQDKRAFGVYNMAKFWGTSGSASGNGDDIDELHPEYRYKHTIQSIGDGYILVSNQNGNIEIGDYLTTASGSGGYACKQNDDLLHNYTVAKANENVDWSNESVTTKLIACTYHCG